MSRARGGAGARFARLSAATADAAAGQVAAPPAPAEGAEDALGEVMARIRADVPAFRELPLDDQRRLAASAYRQAARGLAGGREDRRAQFLRGLLEGALPRAEAESRAAAYGLLPGGRYMAVRARGVRESGAARLVRTIETTGGADGRGALAAVLDGEVCAVVSSEPQLDGDAVAGIGSPVELGSLDVSFRLASRALATAVAFGISGVANIDSLSLRTAVLAEDHVGDTLVRRYLEPLRALGEFGDTLVTTVRQYLASGMRIDESARELIVHPNTMRHRLERFQELTGADLRSIDGLVEVWWALERHAILRRANGAERS